MNTNILKILFLISATRINGLVYYSIIKEYLYAYLFVGLFNKKIRI